MNSYLEAVQAHLTELPQEESGDLIAYYQEYFIESDLTLEEIKAQYAVSYTHLTLPTICSV